MEFLLVSPTYERGLELSLINLQAEWGGRGVKRRRVFE